MLKEPLKSRASYVEDEKRVPPTPDESKELTIEDYRGRRKLQEIKIETYNSEGNIIAINLLPNDNFFLFVQIESICRRKMTHC